MAKLVLLSTLLWASTLLGNLFQDRIVRYQVNLTPESEHIVISSKTTSNYDFKCDVKGQIEISNEDNTETARIDIPESNLIFQSEKEYNSIYINQLLSGYRDRWGTLQLTWEHFTIDNASCILTLAPEWTTQDWCQNLNDLDRLNYDSLEMILQDNPASICTRETAEIIETAKEAKIEPFDVPWTRQYPSLAPLALFKNLQQLEIEDATNDLDLRPLLYIPSLRKLELDEPAFYSDRPFAMLRKLTQLTELELEISTLNLERLKGFPIHILDLEVDHLTHPEAIASLPNLTTLIIEAPASQLVTLKSDTITNLILKPNHRNAINLDFLVNFPALLSLELKRMQPGTTIPVLNNLRKFATRSLGFDYNSLLSQPKLDTLTLMSDEVPNYAVLQALPNLRNLTFTRVGWNHKIELENLPTALKTLELFELNRIDSSLLKRFTLLNRLVLDHVEFIPESDYTFLLQMTHVTDLNLSGHYNLQSQMEILTKLTQLSQLTLLYTDLESDDFTIVRTALPTTEIIDEEID